MKIILAAIALLATVGLVASCTAHKYKDPEKRADYFANKIAKRLDLNEEQKAKLDTLKSELLAVRKEMRGKRDETRDAVRELLNQSTLDQKRALALFNDRVGEASDNAPRVLTAMAGLWDSLTPEQQAQVREKMEKHFKRHERYGRYCSHGC